IARRVIDVVTGFSGGRPSTVRPVQDSAPARRGIGAARAEEAVQRYSAVSDGLDRRTALESEPLDDLLRLRQRHVDVFDLDIDIHHAHTSTRVDDLTDVGLRERILEGMTLRELFGGWKPVTVALDLDVDLGHPAL